MIGTSILLAAYLVLILVGCKWVKEPTGSSAFMTPSYTNVLKGLCCILVVLVHLPQGYTNPLQERVGGFSQVSVTLYFLFSAYGIISSINSKPDYLRHFWRNRVLVLCIPFALSCLPKILMGYHPGSGGTYFVLVLLLFYAVTYFAARFWPTRLVWIVCGCVLAYSIVGSATGLLHWPTQALGFAYGALLTRYLPDLKKQLHPYYVPKLVAVTCAAGLLTGAYVLLGDRLPAPAQVLLQNVMVLSLILWVFVITFRLELGNRASRYLGKISYDIFLYHGFVQNLLLSYSESAPQRKLSSGVFLVLMMTLSIGLSVLTHILNGRLTALVKTSPNKGK